MVNIINIEIIKKNVLKIKEMEHNIKIIVIPTLKDLAKGYINALNNLNKII